MFQEGSSFFDGWAFTNEADIWTSGIAQYVDQGTAVSNDLGCNLNTSHRLS